jgi:RNA polymerase sigma factor (TIGR02999 family)
MTSSLPESESRPPEDGSTTDAHSVDSPSTDDFLAVAYQELRRLAYQKMAAESPGLTLQPTALVHEAYLRLISAGQQFQNEAHFFAAVAEAMRRILVERARRRSRVKHGGGQARASLEGQEPPLPQHSDEDLLSMDAIIDELERQDPRLAEVVKLRYYAGLTSDETAAALGLAPRTVFRSWNTAKAWLRIELERARHGT